MTCCGRGTESPPATNMSNQPSSSSRCGRCTWLLLKSLMQRGFHNNAEQSASRPPKHPKPGEWSASRIANVVAGTFGEPAFAIARGNQTQDSHRRGVQAHCPCCEALARRAPLRKPQDAAPTAWKGSLTVRKKTSCEISSCSSRLKASR